MSGTPKWLETAAVLQLHMEQLAEHGGGLGVRDEGLLDSALARPKNLLAYGEPDIVRFAAAYAYGIVQNHPFIDGNKRMGFLTAYIFLTINGYDVTASEPDVVRVMLMLAANELDEETFTAWLRVNVAPL